MGVKGHTPALAEALESRRKEVAAERGALEAATALTMKPIGAENWAGPASRRRDNIGAPVRQAFVHVKPELQYFCLTRSISWFFQALKFTIIHNSFFLKMTAVLSSAIFCVVNKLETWGKYNSLVVSPVWVPVA